MHLYYQKGFVCLVAEFRLWLTWNEKNKSPARNLQNFGCSYPRLRIRTSASYTGPAIMISVTVTICSSITVVGAVLSNIMVAIESHIIIIWPLSLSFSSIMLLYFWLASLPSSLFFLLYYHYHYDVIYIIIIRRIAILVAIIINSVIMRERDYCQHSNDY